MKPKLLLKFAGSLVLHVVALVVILYFFWPIARWYFEHRPTLGVDFFNTATFARHFRDNLQFLPRDFLDIWYGGWPNFQLAVLTWFKPVGIVANFIPLLSAVKYSVLSGFFLLLTFTYLASYRLSKNHLFSVVISVLVSYSANMYGALTWGGSIPYFLNQAMLPAVLWLLASFLDTGNKRWFWVAILVYGFSLLGHMALAGAFIVPASVILLLFGSRKLRNGEKISFKKKLGEIAIFFLGGYLLAYRVTRGILSGLLTHILSGNILNPFGLGGGSKAQVQIGEGGLTVSGDKALIAFERSQFNFLLSDTSQLLFLLFGISVLLLIIGFALDRKKSKVFSVIPWLLIAGYSVAHVFLNAYGIQVLSQAWYRAFWHFPITLGLATASLVGYAQMSFSRLKKVIGHTYLIILSVSAVLVLAYVYQDGQVDKTLSILEPRTSPASAHPEAINLARSQEEIDKIKEKLTPDWLDPTDKNYRLFTTDAQVNVWWSALFDMPLARGYLDPPLGTGVVGNHFLLDQAVAGNGLVENFEYSESVAKSMALYYIDWYSLTAMEGGHLSKSPNKGASTYLKEEVEEISEVAIEGAYVLFETKSGKPEVWEDVPQYLKFFKFKDELVSPVLSQTSAPAVLCICNWPAYESLTKTLSMNNINSQYLTTAFWDQNLDKLSVEDLQNFEVVVLIDYEYRNSGKVYQILLDYAESGGKIIIETGTELFESQNSKLPEIFPFTQSERAGLGREWDFSELDRDLFKGIKKNEFSPPLFNDDEWKFSYPTGSVKATAEVLVKNSGKPVLIKMPIGEGQVVWSGMNLLYHINSYNNFEESKFYINLLESLVILEKKDFIAGEPQFIDSRRAIFTANSNSRGVMFREQFFDGWKIKVNGKTARAFPAGPTYPGFIYVPLDSENGAAKLSVSFEYWGSRDHYLSWLMSGVLALILFDLALTDGRIVGKRLLILAKKFKKLVGSWWEKEEEY